MDSQLLCFKLGSATRKIQRYYNSKYAELGITVAQSFVLFSLISDNGQNIKHIAQDVDLDSSAITGLIDRLEKEKLVERRPEPEDRRAFCIFLTSKGEDIAKKAQEIARETNEKLNSFATRDQQEFLNSYLDSMDKILNQKDCQSK